MAKKSFKDNPALQFLSVIEEEQEAKAEQKAPEAPQDQAESKAPAGYKLNPLYVETKTKRLQLVLQPSLFERVKATAANNSLSVNEYCHQILDKATREE